MRNKVVKMVREILFLLLPFLLSLPMTLSPGFASNEKALVLVGDKDYIPIEYLHEGIPNGLNVEFLQELSKVMGRKIHIRLMQWKDAQQKVLDGEADGLTVLSITEKRKKLYDFSEVTLEFEFSLFVRSDEVRIFDVSDLEGKSVGVTEGGFPRQVLESNSKINLVFIENYPEGFHLLTSHEIDAVGADTWVGGYIVQEHGIKGVKIAGKPFAKKKAAIAVKKGNLKLLNDINLGIRELKEDGTIQKIIDKWSPKEVVFLTKEKIHSIILFVSISLLLLLLVAVLLWILMLRKQVKTRTGLLQKATDELEIKVKELKAEITERKRAEKALQESEERYRTIFELAADSIVLVDAETGELAEFNKRAHENLGFTRGEFKKLKIPDFEVIQDAEEVSRHIKKIIKQGADTFETKHRTKSGEVRDIHVSSRAISIGGRIFLQGIWRDITDLNQAKEALKESEATARALINAPTDSVFLIDTRGIILDINETAARKSDKHADEYIGSCWYDLYSPDPAENRKEQANKVIQSGKPVRFENEVDGIWFDTVIYPITDVNGEVTRLAIIARDITERKNAEEELKKYRTQLEELVKKRTSELIMTNEKLSHEINVRIRTEKRLRETELQYRTIANFTYDWVYWEAPDGKIIYVSPSCERITGYTQEEFLKDPGLMRKMIISDDRNIWDQHRNEVLKEQKLCEVQFRIRRKDGEIRWIEHACRPVIEDQGSFLGIRASNRDITERKNMEEALRESESSLKRAQEVAHMGSWHLDIGKDDLYWSEAVYEIFGVPIGSPLNYGKFLEIVHPEDRKFVDAKWKEALRKGPFDKQSYDIEHRIIVDGKVKWVKEKAEVEFNKKGEAIRGVGIVQDITDRKAAEENAHRLKEELIHTSRISTVGELTAALAHELNQPLTAILSNAQAIERMTARRNPDMAEIREILSDIIKEDRRASGIIQKSRALLKRSKSNLEQLDVNQVIKEIIPLIRSDVLIRKISLQLDLDGRIPPVCGERIQLQQVILNLLANGMDAMNNLKSKNLTIRTEQADSSMVRVSVEDSGVGVDEEHIEDLFAPFYTTKKDGMGMGLAISHTIIDAHGGKLWAKNNPDHGATFFFTIPVATDRSA